MARILDKLRDIFTDSTYDTYWKKHRGAWSYGIQFVDSVTKLFEFNSCLDAGCGQSDVVRLLLKQGYDVKGIELSEFILKSKANDLLKSGHVLAGNLVEIPFEDNKFELTVSFDVLEHIPEKDIDRVVSELVRVTKKYLFLTISLRPSSNNNAYHVTLKPREWWESKFLSHNGVNKRTDIISGLQKVIPGASVKDIMMEGPTKTIINELEWFMDTPPYDLKGECEPWYFAFEKVATD